MSEHSLVLDIVIRFLRLLGCPHACGEKMVSFATIFYRSNYSLIIVIMNKKMVSFVTIFYRNNFFLITVIMNKVWGSAEFLRGQCIALLTRLLWTDKKQFKW